MILSAVLHGWLAVMMHFEPILSVFSEISVVSAFILSALLFTMSLYVSCRFVLGILSRQSDIICL